MTGPRREFARPLYYDRDGQVITRDEWVNYFEDESYRRVGSTMVRKRWHLSTVWLGLDHGYVGVPMTFETAAFDLHDVREIDIGGMHDTYNESEILQRYSTLDQARRGHRHWVREYRRKEVGDG